VESNLEILTDLAQEVSTHPRFVFVHLPAPHAPLIFDANGQTLPSELETLFHQPGPQDDRRQHRRQYRDNLKHLNGLVASSVRDLVQTADQGAVIILMSDHGSRSRGDVSVLAPADVDEQFGNFFAARVPGEPRLFPGDVMPANVLPILLNHYLGTALPRSPNLLVGMDGEIYSNPDR
jgi:hypothetical protein